MNTQISMLFTLDVTHAYYGGVCRDFVFLVPRDTAETLRRGRLIVKVLDGRLYVLVEKADGNAGGPLVSIAGTVLRIGLKLDNPLFANFTALSFKPGTFVALYDNRANAAALGAPAVAAFRGQVFAHDLSRPDRPADVAVKNSTGATIATQTVTAANNLPSVSFDLTGYPAGRYTVAEDFPGGVKNSTAYYLDPELSREAILAVAEIGIDAAFYNAAAAFTIRFDAREETLKYYVVASDVPAADIAKLKVTDLGFGDDKRDEVKFKPAMAPLAPIPGVPPADDHTTIALVQSDTPIARRAKGRRRIQLTYNATEIISNLPQPGPERLTADLIVHVAKPKP